MEKIKAFNKWDTEGVTITDPGLKDYIELEPKIVPKTGATYAGSKFYKSKTFIVEHLINKLMVPGHKAKKHTYTSSLVTGCGQSAYNTVEQTLTIIEQRLKKNPIQVVMIAIENASPRKGIVSIEY